MNIFFDDYSGTDNWSGIQWLSEDLYRWVQSALDEDLVRLGFGKNYTNNKLLQASAKRLPTKLANRLHRYNLIPKLEKFTTEPINIVFFPNFVAWPTEAKKNIVAVHDLTFIDIPVSLSAANRTYLQSKVPESIENASAVIVSTELTKHRIAKQFKYPVDKVFIIPPLPRKLPVSKLPAEMPKKYILTVNSIEPRKNYGKLLEAFELLRSEQPELELVIVGAKRPQGIADHTKILAAKDTGVTHLGHVDDELLGSLYANAAAFVNASSYEGFGMSILEAQTAGCPVACSDIEVFKEVAGKAASFFDPESPESIKAGIVKAMNNKETKSLNTANLARFTEAGNIKTIKAAINC